MAVVLTTLLKSLGRLWTQLRTGSGTEGEDCGAIAVINLIQFASHGKVGPSYGLAPSNPDSVASWVKRVRRWSNNATGPMMVRGDVLQALNHPDLKLMFKRAGVGYPDVAYHYGMGFGDLRKYLAASTSHAAMVAIDYGVARREGAPMGSTTFSMGHAITMHGAQQLRVKVGGRYRRLWYTVVGDSLMDGRRKPGSLKRYPKGYLRTRLYRYMKAAGAFGSPNAIGDGRAICITVTRGHS